MGTADERHSERRNARSTFPSGKWQRHLLMYARLVERDATTPGPWRTWNDSVVKSPSWPLPKDPYSGAADALNALEEQGHVVVKPERHTSTKRRAIDRFRLTPSGREVADTLIANDGRTPAMAKRERLKALNQDPDGRSYKAWHALSTEARRQLLQPADVDLEEELEELERALGPDPDTNHHDVVVRTAARYYVWLLTDVFARDKRDQVDPPVPAEGEGWDADDRFPWAERADDAQAPNAPVEVRDAAEAVLKALRDNPPDPTPFEEVWGPDWRERLLRHVESVDLELQHRILALVKKPE